MIRKVNYLSILLQTSEMAKEEKVSEENKIGEKFLFTMLIKIKKSEIEKHTKN